MTARVLQSRATPRCLDDLHAFLEDLWQQAPEVAPPARTALSTALAELVANVIQHGRTSSGDTPLVRLEVEVKPDRLQATLRDDGGAIPPPPAEPSALLAEAGRGMHLARAAVDHLTYRREGSENIWVLEVSRRTP